MANTHDTSFRERSKCPSQHLIFEPYNFILQEMKKNILYAAVLSLALFYPNAISAQDTSSPNKHLNASLTAGTTGLGIDFAYAFNPTWQVRAGASFIPKFNYETTFEVWPSYDPEGLYERYEHLASKMEEITGASVDNQIGMIASPSFRNINLMLDVFPFRNKHWHITAGVYLGPGTIARIENTPEDIPSLMAVNIFNFMYDKAANDDPIATLGDFDIYYEGILNYGRMGMETGNLKSDGAPYVMVPDEDNMVHASITVNRVKPYIGFGFGGNLIKNDDRYGISFDCGVMSWGGSPSITTKDGIDMVHDLENVPGRIGQYCDIVRAFKIYPVLNLRLSRRLF